MKRLLKICAVSILSVAFFAGSTFAAGFDDCMGPGKDYENLSVGANAEYPVYCTSYTEGTETVKIYGKTSADCQQAAAIVSNPDKCFDSSSQSKEVLTYGGVEGNNRGAGSSATSKEDDGLDVITIVLIAALCASLLLNVILIVLLARKKNTRNFVQVTSAPASGTSTAPANASTVDVDQVYPAQNQN